MARKNNNSVSDEEIIVALLSNGTIKAAASTAGISERAIYNRMSNSDFIILYNAAKMELLRTAVINLNNQLQGAIDTVAEIMQDSGNNAAVRLQAAQTILSNASKFSERLKENELILTNQIRSANNWL